MARTNWVWFLPIFKRAEIWHLYSLVSGVQVFINTPWFGVQALRTTPADLFPVHFVAINI